MTWDTTSTSNNGHNRAVEKEKKVQEKKIPRIRGQGIPCEENPRFCGRRKFGNPRIRGRGKTNPRFRGQSILCRQFFYFF
jgi:hypothetical protein